MNNDAWLLASSAEHFYGLYNYWIVVFLMMTGFFIVISRKNMIKTVIGLNIFQTSVFLLYITMGKVNGGTAPIIPPDQVPHDTHGHDSEHAHEHGLNQLLEPVSESNPIQAISTKIESSLPLETVAEHGSHEIIYSNPLPSVLMLTAIVVGVATTALALALIVRIREDYGTIEEDEIMIMDRES